MNGSTRLRDLGKDIRLALRGARRVIWGAVAVLLAGWLLSGASCIEAEQVGFVRRFGAVVRRDIEPGFVFLLPWPIETLDTVQRKEIRRAEAGFCSSPKSLEMHVSLEPERPAEENVPYTLTGDQNIIHVGIVAQYQIKDPYRFRYKVRDADQILIHVLNEAIIGVTAKMSVDAVLTTGKEMLRTRTRRFAQKVLDELGAGLVITRLQLATPPTVPRETEAAFQAVVDAKVSRETAEDEALKKRKDLLENARGYRAKVLNDAYATKNERIRSAEGETKRFADVLEEYEVNPSVTRVRMYLEMMGELMRNVRKYVLPPGQVMVPGNRKSLPPIPLR
ncbi:MAG: FtsH protease activity modulator HflK [Planctomycetota bacterium]